MGARSLAEFPPTLAGDGQCSPEKFAEPGGVDVPVLPLGESGESHVNPRRRQGALEGGVGIRAIPILVVVNRADCEVIGRRPV